MCITQIKINTQSKLFFQANAVMKENLSWQKSRTPRLPELTKKSCQVRIYFDFQWRRYLVNYSATFCHSVDTSYFVCWSLYSEVLESVKIFFICILVICCEFCSDIIFILFNFRNHWILSEPKWKPWKGFGWNDDQVTQELTAVFVPIFNFSFFCFF